MKATVLVAAVNLRLRIVILDGDEIIPITNMIDCDGEETNDHEECVSFVAGPTPDGGWITDLASSYQPVTVV